MKKIVCTMLCIMLLFGLSACGGDVSEVKTHNVESESYSEEDIKAAIDTIKKEFKSDWKGCTLTEIYYAGDDCTKDHKDWADRNNADEVIVLLSSFDVDSSGGDGSLNPNSTYSDWKWILVRTDGGKWQHVDPWILSQIPVFRTMQPITTQNRASSDAGFFSFHFFIKSLFSPAFCRAAESCECSAPHPAGAHSPAWPGSREP